VAPRATAYPEPMTRKIGLLALLVLIPFAVFSTWVIARAGYTGFLGLAAREPWGLQILLDLTIACALYLSWLVPDARRHRIPAWPYVLVTLFGGSVGGLAYLVHRALVTGVFSAPDVESGSPRSSYR